MCRTPTGFRQAERAVSKEAKNIFKVAKWFFSLLESVPDGPAGQYVNLKKSEHTSETSGMKFRQSGLWFIAAKRCSLMLSNLFVCIKIYLNGRAAPVLNAKSQNGDARIFFLSHCEWWFAANLDKAQQIKTINSNGRIVNCTISHCFSISDATFSAVAIGEGWLWNGQLLCCKQCHCVVAGL